MTVHYDNELETLTQRAVSAAKAGQWDTVTTLYERRGQLLSAKNVSPDMARRLEKLDRVVLEKISFVQAATQQNILEIQERRRKLDQWKQSWVPTSERSSRFSHAV